MTNPVPPPSPSTPGAENPAASPVDEHLHTFWKKNGQTILIGCGLVLLAYLGKEGWEYFAQQKEQGIEQEFAAAQTPEKLQSFADAHPDHALAGVAELEIGDQAYAAGRLDGAITAYGRAVDALKAGPLAARAKLGLAMAKIQAGQAADGTAALQQLADDTAQFRAIRAEATYQLASLAAAGGKSAEVQRLLAQLMQIDPNSPWTQRAYALQAQAANGGATPPAPAGGISFRPAGK